MKKGISLFPGRFCRGRQGAVAIEFALIALPFFLLVVGVLEMAFFFTFAVVLEGATVAAARVIRTGQAQLSADPLQTFQDALCNQVTNIMQCGRITFEVIHPAGDSFEDADGIPPTFDSDGNLVSSGFDPGGISDVVVVRTAYRYQFLVPFVASMFANNSDNGVTLMSTVTLRSEPYDFED